MKQEAKLIQKYSISNLTDVGLVRDSNQDYYGRYQGPYGELLIVCDGIGGYHGGEEASRIAVEAISSHFMGLPAGIDPRRELAAALERAQKGISQYAGEHPEAQDMGTTAVVLLLRDDQYWFAWIGDSRIYLKRANSTHPITKDHSYVQELVEQGLLEPEKAVGHPKKNVITRSLGGNPDEPEIRGPFTVNRGDVFMLCTDGLSDYFADAELNRYLSLDPLHACKALVDEAKRRGGKDNITLQVVKSNIGQSYAGKQKRKASRYVLAGIWATAIVLFLLTGALLLRRLQVWPFAGPASDSLSVSPADSFPEQGSAAGSELIIGNQSDADSDSVNAQDDQTAKRKIITAGDPNGSQPAIPQSRKLKPQPHAPADQPSEAPSPREGQETPSDQATGQTGNSNPESESGTPEPGE